jgi:hypothetical protein
MRENNPGENNHPLLRKSEERDYYRRGVFSSKGIFGQYFIESDMSAHSSRLEPLFVSCKNNARGVVDLKAITKLLWAVLDNNVTYLDIANIYTLTVSSLPHSDGKSIDSLDRPTFLEVLNAVARVKFPAVASDFLTNLLNAIEEGKEKNCGILKEPDIFSKMTERSLIQELLTFDFPLRRMFATYAGPRTGVGAGLKWEEAQQLGIGMELKNFVALCASSSLVPRAISKVQLESLCMSVLNEMPLIASSASQNSVLMYPQFQVLLCILGNEIHELEKEKKLGTRDSSMDHGGFAKKVANLDALTLSELLHQVLVEIGVTHAVQVKAQSSLGTESVASSSGARDKLSEPSVGDVSMPQHSKPEDLYRTYMNQGRQAMYLRMEHLFDQVEMRLREEPVDAETDFLIKSSKLNGEAIAPGGKYAAKPVVVGDALPIPEEIPEEIQELLEAALGHHNLGAYEESIKFLEAARVQLVDLKVEELLVERQAEDDRFAKEAAERARRDADMMGNILDDPTPDSAGEGGAEAEGLLSHQSSSGSACPASSIEGLGGGLGQGSLDFDGNLPGTQPTRAPITAKDVALPFALENYIQICTGNVYQSSGDDEKALQQYMLAWNRAQKAGDREWQMVCVSALGALCYYSVRYEVALLCFSRVLAFRMATYGATNSDTASALNNEACALYALNEKSGSRIRFEKAWQVLCDALGHRHPRAVTVFRNVERARRVHATLNKQDLTEGIALREDADRLIMGGQFTVVANGPPVATKKKKGGKKKGKKK